MARVSYVVPFVIIHLLLLCFAQEEKSFNPRCPRFHCGVLGNIGFPFSNLTHPECGLLFLDNCNEPFPQIQLGNGVPWFYTKTISQVNMVVLVDQGFANHKDNHSCISLQKLTLPISPYLSFTIPYGQNLFKCPRNYSVPKDFNFLCNNAQNTFIFHPYPRNHLPSSPPQCSPVNFGVNKTQKSVEYSNLNTDLFALKVNVTEECYDCFFAGGQFQTDDSTGKFNCSNQRTASVAGDAKLGLKLGLAISATGICLLIILVFCFRKMLSWDNSRVFWKKKTKDYQNIEVFLRNYGSFAPKRYTNSDTKKMTNSFKDKLGQGGYGGVYKGRLLDGRYVAVKVLNESKGNGEEFINEVASISRTSHVNIVTLLGFCFEGCRRALIYEFVPNGSLEKFIYEKHSLETNHQLEWGILYQIAVGIARGLEYLHRGCSTRILHFDIKPHNILLDEDFCPKISDFGLAKICTKNESNISMTGARGTIGYIAPEVFCRNFGAVSHKSDVYSYGMMVLEMAGGRKNVDIRVDHSSEIYFPHWIYQRLEVDEDVGLQGISNEEDRECARKMIIVSLWCIQTNPSDRPTMSRVVDMLEGSLVSLQIPPKPFLSSPKSRTDSSTSFYDNIVIQ